MDRACGMHWGRGQAYNVLAKKKPTAQRPLLRHTRRWDIVINSEQVLHP